MRSLLSINIRPYQVALSLPDDRPDDKKTMVHVILPHELSGVLFSDFPTTAGERLVDGDSVRDFSRIADEASEPFCCEPPVG